MLKNATKKRKKTSKGRWLKTNNTDQAGFTTLEVIVAMAIVTIVGGALVSGISGALKLSIKAKSTAMDAVRILKIDDQLREAAADVIIPYWERSIALEEGNEGLTIPYYQGKADQSLSIRMQDERLQIDRNGSVYTVEGIENPNFSVLSSKGGYPIALDISYRIADRDFHVIAPFGGHPLAGTDR